MSEQLRVEISGDSKDLQQATKRATKDLKKFKKVVDGSLDGVNKPTKDPAGGINKLKNAAVNANPTLQEFSRIIQDAPFGIQGVGNNITQLVSNFGNLSKKVGGSKAAFKVLASSFIGPAGILFAVSTVVSLLTVFGDQLFKTKTDAEKLAEANDKAAKSLERYKNTLTELNREQLKSVQSSGKEIVNLRLLINAAQDASRSTTDRAKAVQELRSKFPEYFNDLSNEKILNGDLSETYETLSKSIINRAKATGASNLIIKNAEEELLILNKIANAQKKIDKLEQDQLLKTSGVGGAQQEGLKAALESRIAILKVGNAASQFEIDKIQEQNEELIKQIEDLGGIDLSGVKLNTSKEAKIKINPNFIITGDALQTLESSGDLAAKNLQKGVDKASEKINLDFAEEQLKRGLNRLGNLKIGEKTELELSLERLNTRIRGTIADGLSNSLAGLGQSLGEALAQGGDVISAIGNGLLSSLGGFLSRMGQLLIEYGTLAVLKGKLDLAIVAGGPVAIGAGLAAIAVGIALSAAGAALSSAATGGASGGGGSVSGGGSSNNRSFTSSSGGGFGDGPVVFEIAGTKLLAVLNRTIERNSSLGGGNLSLG